MKFQGREIDPISLWEQYVEFPHNMRVDGKFLPLVTCPNPDHDTIKRHFQINIEQGLVHCFAGCGISGTFTNAISLIEGISERDARKVILAHKRSSRTHLRRIADRNHREPKRVNELPEFDTFLPAVALDYLSARGITENSVATWELGWDSEEKRLVIPAKDQRGITRFLIKRSVLPRQSPKYLYAPDGASTKSLLFGGCQTDPVLIRSTGLILVEGSFDEIRLYQHGIRNAVGTLGTGISEIQCNIVSRLRPRRIFTFFDRDTAGINGIEIVARRLRKYPLYVIRYPAGRYDPAELSGREVERAISRAIPFSRFMVRQNQAVNAN
jgi:DNA primase